MTSNTAMFDPNHRTLLSNRRHPKNVSSLQNFMKAEKKCVTQQYFRDEKVNFVLLN